MKNRVNPLLLASFCAFLLGILPASAQERLVITAPEAPFPFEPLELFSFPGKDFPITKYGARPGGGVGHGSRPLPEQLRPASV